mgnify:CR=1 FL=1
MPQPNRRHLFILLALAALFFFSKDSTAGDTIYTGRVWEVTCANGVGTNLNPSAAPTPQSAFKIKNLSGVTIYLAAEHQAPDATTNGYPIANGDTESIEGPPGNWECWSVAGGAVIELIGGSR